MHSGHFTSTSMSIDGGVDQNYLMGHVSGDTYEFSLSIPQGSTAELQLWQGM
ncbi:MAG: hypothetical protein KGD64_14470 [Candidatus Heimdallarchaeota archaeon]|nr:hypothetical protein [Candidatus Heimdallarchaeota archaeon]